MDGRSRLLLREMPPLAASSPIEDPHHPLHASAHHRVDIHHHRPPPYHLHPAIIEERIAAQNHEIQSLLLDNQHLGATHVALKQELAAAQRELRHISAAANQIKADRDAEVREVYDRSLKLEAEVRAMDALNAELAQVRSDVQKLSASKLELTSQLQAINDDLRARQELHQVFAVKAEIEHMHHELQMGRAAIEYEKKTHAHNLEQRQAMEKNMAALSREVEQLRVELANANKRARAAAAAAAAASPGSVYAGSHGNPEMGYGVHPYVEPYSMHQVQGGVDAGVRYGSGAVSHGPYDMQQTQEHR